MMYHKLISLAIIAIFLAQANAEAGDPLDPSQLGESMSMPLPQELIQSARNAGVITGSNSLLNSDRQKPSFSVAPQPEADAVNSIDHVNVTGDWSFKFNGTSDEQMKMQLLQNQGVVMGQGVINLGNETQNATISGSISGDELSLAVMPMGVLKLYQLNLSLSSLASGTFAVYTAEGKSWDGDLTFSVSSNIFKSGSS